MPTTKWDIFDLKQLDNNYADFYAKLLGFVDSATLVITDFHNKNGKSPPIIQSTFLEDKNINARVRKLNNTYHIGIHVALPCILHFCFNNLLRTQVYLPHIGNVSNETHYRDFSSKGIPLLLPIDVPLHIALPGIINQSRPLDNARASAAVALTQIAVSFCIYHELQHIEIGHVNSNCELFGQEEFLEFFDWRNWLFPQKKLRKIWEYEADQIAAMMVASDMLSEINADSFEETFHISLKESPEGLMGIALLAMYAVFHLFNQRAHQKYTASSHPHPLVRLGAVVDVVCNSVPKNPRAHLCQDRNREVAIDAIFMTDSAWQELGLFSSMNIKSEVTWQWIFKEIDKLDRDRQALCHRYKDKGWLYPFAE